MEPSDFDLVLERRLDAPVSAVWRAWTTPELVEEWFAPAPVTTRVRNFDLRPGGAFETEMTLPDGTVHAGPGCFLEVVPEERLVFTDALGAGFQPTPEPFMTAVITLAADGDGTLYRAVARHADAAARDRHAEMGFHDGWGAVAGQLEAVARRIAGA